MYTACRVFLYFLIYSVVGWACETVWCSVGSRKFVNRGFLNGPICPIYGFGALLVIYLLHPYTENWLTVFLAGIVTASALEYVTSVLLEKLFRLKLWDYSKNFCNLNGRVCLRNSILFGLMAVLLVWFLHPGIEGLVGRIAPEVLIGLSVGLAVVLIADLTVTVFTVLRLNSKLDELQKMLDDLADGLGEKAEELQKGIEARVDERRERAEACLTMVREDLAGLAEAKGVSVRERIDALNAKWEPLQNRFIQAFPTMRSQKNADSLKSIRDRLSRRHKQ